MCMFSIETVIIKYSWKITTSAVQFIIAPELIFSMSKNDGVI